MHILFFSVSGFSYPMHYSIFLHHVMISLMQGKRHPGSPKPRLFTVGRLDVATSGLIIVTNDGMIKNCVQLQIIHANN